MSWAKTDSGFPTVYLWTLSNCRRDLAIAPISVGNQIVFSQHNLSLPHTLLKA